MDEQPVRLRGEAREPIRMNEYHSKREDREYERKGTCSVCMCGTAGREEVCIGIAAEEV
jgi:hypothetical protein